MILNLRVSGTRGPGGIAVTMPAMAEDLGRGSIGIEKGFPFEPNAERRKILDHAAAEAQEYLLDQYVNGINLPFYADRQWSSAVPPGAVPTDFSWQFPGYLDVDGRGAGYYVFYTSVKISVPPPFTR